MQSNKRVIFNKFRDINYPFFKDHDNVNCIDFLIDIDKTLNNECDFSNFKHDKFAISNLDEKLIENLKYILSDEETNQIDKAFNHLENLYNSEDSDNIFYINQIKMESNNINYVSPKRFYHYYNVKKKKEQNIKQKKIYLNNKSIIKNGSNQNKVNKKEKLSHEQFFYLIEYLYDNTGKNNKEIEDEIIRNMKNFLVYERYNNIMKYLFNDFLVTTENILKLSINEIIINFPSLYELYEFKILLDDLISKELGLKDYINYKGNFINVSKNCLKIKGNRISIFIPSGWFGIGIQYTTIKDNEWVDALLGIGENLPSNEFREILESIIINRLIKEKEKYQDEKNNKSIENKVHFSTQIGIIENYSGYISFYDSKYRIVFLVKIKKSLLKNLENISLFNLSKDNMIIQTIILKKIID
jgi:hypothetical protein